MTSRRWVIDPSTLSVPSESCLWWIAGKHTSTIMMIFFFFKDEREMNPNGAFERRKKKNGRKSGKLGPLRAEWRKRRWQEKIKTLWSRRTRGEEILWGFAESFYEGEGISRGGGERGDQTEKVSERVEGLSQRINKWCAEVGRWVLRAALRVYWQRGGELGKEAFDILVKPFKQATRRHFASGVKTTETRSSAPVFPSSTT